MPLVNFAARRPGLLAALTLLLCANAFAQSNNNPSLERQIDEAFRQVLEQPQNLPLWSAYSRLLISQGNYEGGIAALERLLLEPDPSPSLRVDIGVLYYRLASYAQAEAMLRSALADGRLPADQRGLAEALIADIAKRSQPSQLSGAATFGLRHQSNPMFRTDSAQITSGNVLVPTPANQGPESNTDANLGLSLRHFYDLERQNSAAILSTFGAYLSKYASSGGSQIVANPTRPYDLTVLDFSTGVQFKPLPADWQGLTIRPHVLWSNVTAQGKQYINSHGLGLDATWRFTERTLLDLTIDSQRRDFEARIDVPDAARLDGRLDSLRARLAHELGAGQTLSADYAFRRNRAGRDYYNSESHEITARYAVSYASPIAGGSNWTTTIYAGALRRSYGAPDPAVSTTTTRRDREMRVGVSQFVPLTPAWSLLFALEHARNSANLTNFSYKNTTLSSTVIRSF
jgi:hypothetical protein